MVKKMNFCSSHVFVYSSSESEAYTDDEEIDLNNNPYNKPDKNINKNNHTHESLGKTCSEQFPIKHAPHSQSNTSILYEEPNGSCPCGFCGRECLNLSSIHPQSSTSNQQNVASNSCDVGLARKTFQNLQMNEIIWDSNSSFYIDNSDNFLSASHEKLYKQNSLTHINHEINCPSNLSSIKSYVRIRKPDTNIIAVKLDKLIETHVVEDAEPIYCEKCQAVLTASVEINEHKWICEFCGNFNRVLSDVSKLRVLNDVTFSLAKKASEIDAEFIVYCIDISGSMNVTVENTDANNEKPDEKYISRLFSLQCAINKSLEKLKNEHPNKRVSLIAFNDQLIIIGDGTSQPKIIHSNDIFSEDDLLIFVDEMSRIKPIKETVRKLERRVLSLQANGATALGPALLLSVHIASRKSGSQVILCTDGMANLNFGNLEDNVEEAIIFYENLTNYALSNSVSVSIITLKGTGCKLSIIGQLAERTNGFINCVDQLKMKDEIVNIIKKRTIASNVTITLIAHKSIYIFNNGAVDVALNKSISKYIQIIGNVYDKAEITLQYGIKCNHESLRELEALEKIPFQLQITYNLSDGSKLMRVITEYRPYTRDRRIAERSSSLNLVAKHTLTTQAKAITHQLSSNRGFSKLKYSQRVKSVARYLSSHQYSNDSLRNSFQSLLQATNSKSNRCRDNGQNKNQASNNSDEESETIIRLASLHSTHF